MSKKKSFWSLSFVMVILINVFNGLSSYMVNPIMSTYLVDRGLSFALTGLIASLMSWVALLFRPFSGAASDRFNKKTMLFVSYLCVGICMIGYHLSHSAVLSTIIRVIHGVAFAVSGTVALAFGASFVPIEALGESLGYLTLGNLVGQMIGPQFGSMIADRWGIDVNFLIAAAFNFIAVVIICFLPYTSEEKKNQDKKISLGDFFGKELIVYVILVAILSLGNGTLSYYLKSYGDYRGIANISLFYTVTSIVMLFSKPQSGKLHDRKGIQFILYPGYILDAAAFFLIGQAKVLPVVLTAAVLKAIGQGCSTTAIQSECVRTLGKERSGVAVSTCYIGQDIGNALGPTMAAYMISAQGYEFMFFMNAVFLLCGLVIFHFYYSMVLKKQNGKTEEQSA